MSSLVLLGFRIGLLALLWLFILMALRSLRRDTNAIAQTGSGVAPSLPGAPVRRHDPAREIRIVKGPLEGSHMPLETLDEVVIGRSDTATFQVGDDYASAHHARLFKRGGDWFVEDLDSRNGTFVGAFRIDQPERVSLGSDIRIGRTTVRLLP